MLNAAWVPRWWRTLPLAALLAGHTEARSQDHLEPEQGSLNEFEGWFEHVKKQRESLLREEPEYYEARVICFEFGQPAWVVTVVREVEDTYHLRYATFVPKGEEFEALRLSVPFDPELSQQVRTLWFRMLRGVRYPEIPTTGADGANYHFSRAVPFSRGDSPGFEAGTIWSPHDGSLTAQLVELGETLRRVAIASHEGLQAELDSVRLVADRFMVALDDPNRPEHLRPRGRGKFVIDGDSNPFDFDR